MPSFGLSNAIDQMGKRLLIALPAIVFIYFQWLVLIVQVNDLLGLWSWQWCSPLSILVSVIWCMTYYSFPIIKVHGVIDTVLAFRWDNCISWFINDLGPTVQITQTQADIRDTREPFLRQGGARNKGKARAHAFYGPLIDQERSPNEEDYNADEEGYPDPGETLYVGDDDGRMEQDDSRNKSVDMDLLDDDPNQEGYSKGTSLADNELKEEIYSQGTCNGDQAKVIALVMIFLEP